MQMNVDNSLPVNLPLLFKLRAKTCPAVTAQAAKDKKGIFKLYGFKSVYEKILLFALALKELGITKGTHTALISDNRREWLIADFALLSLGAVDVPRGCDSTATELHYIISFADCTFGIFENMIQLNKVLEKSVPPALKTVILFDDATEADKNRALSYGLRLYDFRSLMKRGKEIGLSRRFEIEKRWKKLPAPIPRPSYSRRARRTFPKALFLRTAIIWLSLKSFTMC